MQEVTDHTGGCIESRQFWTLLDASCYVSRELSYVTICLNLLIYKFVDQHLELIGQEKVREIRGGLWKLDGLQLR